MAELCRRLWGEFEIAAVTNDIYTLEDAELFDAGRRPAGGPGRRGGDRWFPHTAIRDDVSMNLVAAEDLEKRLAPLDLIFRE